MRTLEKFDDPSDITIPNQDSGSLRPHMVARDDFASGDWSRPTLLSRMGAGPFVAIGIVVGMAAALPVTAWAVRTHRWPIVGSIHGSAAPAPPPGPLAVPSSDLPPIPSPLSAIASRPAPVDALTGTPPAASTASETSVSPNEKIRKKRKGFGKRKPGHADREKGAAAMDDTTERSVAPAARATAPDPSQATTADVAEPSEEQAAAAQAGGKKGAAGPASRASSKPTGPVEDLAAAELSTSLK